VSKKNYGEVILSWLKQLILIILVTIFISVLIIQTYDINDVSMEPTFDSLGNRVIVFVTPYLFGVEPDYGEIVIIDSRVNRRRTFRDKFLESPLISHILRERKEHMWVKRVIGLPGDKLEFIDGAVYRNGQRLEESYIKEEMNHGFSPITVPNGYIYVMGDNRNRSSDSRQIGPVPLENIQGRVIIRFFPFNKFAAY